MDLSFALEQSQRALRWRVTLDDIKAAADSRRLDTARWETDVCQPMSEKGCDRIHVLACRLTSDAARTTNWEMLGGSFNPLVARQLMVGEKGEDGIYRRDLADVQG